MPAETKTAVPHERPTSLEGQTLPCDSREKLEYAADMAFDYRGDVTLNLKNGQAIFGFVFNRNHKTETFEIFIKGQADPVVVSYKDVSYIAFTGEDTAFGKSWDDWQKKQHAERKAEAEKLRQESLAAGYL
jgi:hypothetical protein